MNPFKSIDGRLDVATREAEHALKEMRLFDGEFTEGGFIDLVAALKMQSAAWKKRHAKQLIASSPSKPRQ